MIFRVVVAWLRERFWKIPTSEPLPPLAKDIMKNVAVVEYAGQKICLSTSEVEIFNDMSRKDKRGMAHAFRKMEKAGRVQFEQIDDKWVAIKKKDYGNLGNAHERRDLRTEATVKPRAHKSRSKTR